VRRSLVPQQCRDGVACQAVINPLVLSEAAAMAHLQCALAVMVGLCERYIMVHARWQLAAALCTGVG
jgi:hypothetical protein